MCVKSKALVIHAVFALALLSLLLIGVQAVKAQHTADGKGFPLASPLVITSPSNGTEYSSPLTLNVTFQFMLSPSSAKVTYSIDGADKASLPLTATPTHPGYIFAPYLMAGSAVIPLPNGTHTVAVYAEYHANNADGYDSSSAYFTVTDTTLFSEPTITPTPAPIMTDEVPSPSPSVSPVPASPSTTTPTPTLAPTSILTSPITDTLVLPEPSLTPNLTDSALSSATVTPEQQAQQLIQSLELTFLKTGIIYGTAGTAAIAVVIAAMLFLKRKK
jgi:hypothetical protein